MSGADHRTVFVVLAAADAAFGVLQSLMLPILPTVQHHFHTSQADVTWVLTAYLLSASVATPILGRLGDAWGKDRLLFATLLMLSAGCVLAAVAPSLGVLVVARVVQGAGGGVLPLTFGIIRDVFPPDRVAGAVGSAAGMLAFGGGIGAVITGPIVSVLDYHWLFWFSLLLLVPASIAVRLVVPASATRASGRVNWLSAALLSAGLVALLLGISEGPVWGWSSPAVGALFVLGVALLCRWVRREWLATTPLIDMRTMRIPVVWTTNVAAVLFGMGQFSIVAFLPEFVQTPPSHGYGFGSSLTQSCLFLVPQTVLMFIAGNLCGVLTRRIGGKAVLCCGMLVNIAPYLMLATTPHHTWEIWTASGLTGIGTGLAVSAMATVVVEAVPPTQTGTASGVSANVRTIGGCLGSAIMSTIVTHGGAPDLASWREGFLFLAASSVVGAAVAVAVPGGRRGALRGEAGMPEPLEKPTQQANRQRARP